MRMAKMSRLIQKQMERFVLEIGNIVDYIIPKLIDDLEFVFSEMCADMFGSGLVNGDIKLWYGFLDDDGSGHTPRRSPYTIAYHRKRFVEYGLKRKRKRARVNPVNSVRDPVDVSVLVVGVDAGAGGEFPEGPVVVVAASPCDVAPIGTTSLDGGAVITEYRSEGKVSRGDGPRDADYLAGTNAEPSELAILSNVCTPIGSRSLVDVRGLVPAPPGDTLHGMPTGFIKAFPVNDVPEHVNGFSESLVVFLLLNLAR